ncbi:uncharacterized protein MELLADRAFT_105073 [Melampsora larici-populina 98AG31]|uniref:F-box domain-containing protein n=1 Tax=Melampsora larici-populina (strain 98AG31 / pathotype 3-4-7) TaxID=747676 RepID=F4RH58_MELLP|nr:uncharacterized protein MELLADRAFT_105073 [Melampsora larici-populina 98AG31]EGG08389.1 hypothetical protein MELLADRAFT_105073 [Melampsora larici-populina 98AG31]
MVYHQSAEEHNSIKERKSDRRHYTTNTRIIMNLLVYLGHGGPPVLNSIQNLAVVHRKFYRLCLPKLWQKVAFPTSLPAPISLWTGDLLLKHGNLVKSAQFDLEYVALHQHPHEFSETEMSLLDNTSLLHVSNFRFKIGLLNIAKIFKVCPSLESVSISLQPSGRTSEWVSALAVRLRSPFQLLPQLEHLQLKDHRYQGLSGNFIIDIIKELPSLISLELSRFKFFRKESVEESFGWNLAQLKKLRKLSLECISCEDQTWTLNSWPEPLTNLEIRCCEGMTPEMAHRLLSDHYEIINLLVSFEDCRSLEVLEYHGDMYDDQWNSLKNLLSRRTWPKLVVLDLCYSSLYDGNGRWLGKQEVEELFKPFNIQLLMKKN